MVQPKTGRQETMTAGWATEWRHEEEGSESLPYRLRMGPQEAFLLALWTTQGTAHIIYSFLFPLLGLFDRPRL
ncbi:MAG TPA: hypothetical protein VE222_07195 [Nitrospiraceae bacterium]|nr:hypothetical protein [Nitrospiraceae bacterium]